MERTLLSLKNGIAQGIADLFLPTKRNGNVPRLLSTAGISAYLVVALFLLIAPRYVRVSDLASLVQPFNFTKEQVVNLVNGTRATAGLPPLAINPTLERSAAAKAEDMFARQYFAHVSPAGLTPWDILKNAGYRYVAAGENLASDFARAEDAHAALLASPSHRANLLNPLYTEVGVVVAQGNLNGHPNIVVVQYFGKPRVLAAAPTKPATTKPVTTQPAPAPTKPAATSSTPTTTTVVAGIRIQPAPSGTTSTVLGTTQAVEASRLELARASFMDASSRISTQVKIKIAAFALIALLLITTALLGHRTGAIPFDVATRAFAIFLLLGYLAISGAPESSSLRITPTSFATVTVAAE